MHLFNTIEEAKAHVAALYDIAKSDNDFSDKERKYIENLISLYSSTFRFTLEDIKNIQPKLEDILCNNMTNNRNKWILMQDIISTCYIDGCYTQSEKERVAYIANSLRLDLSKLEQLEQLNEQFVVINNKIATLIGM